MTTWNELKESYKDLITNDNGDNFTIEKFTFWEDNEVSLYDSYLDKYINLCSDFSYPKMAVMIEILWR